MTVEELKNEAENLGYRLMKKANYIRFKPCICGNNYRYFYWIEVDGKSYTIYVCSKCGLKSPPARIENEDGQLEFNKTVEQAKLNWNKMIEEKTNGQQ